MKDHAITVRAYEPTDLDDVLDVSRQPRCISGTLHLPYSSVEEIRSRYESTAEGTRRLVATIEHDGRQRVVGVLGMRQLRGRRSHVGDLGLMVHDDFQRRGVGDRLLEAATELADRWLGLMRLELCVWVDNEAARRLYEKHGFVVEGTHRGFALRNGELVDALAMARLVEPATA